MKGLRDTITVILLCYIVSGVNAQRSDAALFQDEQSLSISLTLSLRDLKRKTNDSTYMPAVLSYKNGEGKWDSIPISIRTRGNFRREHCTYPPLRIKIKKKDAGGTVFAETKSLKLVLPCHESKSNMDLILMEYLCYQLYVPITPYVFNTRLLDITLTETGKHTKTYQLKGFFIEDDDAAANRFNAHVVDENKLNPLLLEDTSALRFDLFQFMIANTDFSTTFFHNTKVVQTNAGYYVPIAYDFDMSGIVDAPYATIDPKWEIKSVRQRVYKGFCRNEKITEFVRQEYIHREGEIYNVIDHHEKLLDTKDFISLKKYIGEFFAVLKDDRSYREQITDKCRTR